jgi:hypothetical protein
MHEEAGRCPASLAPGNSCAVTVTFAPTTVGPQTGTLTINSSAVARSRNVLGYSKYRMALDTAK